LAKQSIQKEAAFTATMPNGMEIKYEAVAHTYDIRRPLDGGGGEGLMSEWRRVDVSMSSVADVLDKPGLKFWGQNVGVDGMIHLWKTGQVRSVQVDGTLTQILLAWSEEANDWVPCDYEVVKALLTKNKLSVNHVKEAAGGRGNSVHAALEDWIETGKMPNPEVFPIEEAGYVEGLVKFLTDLGEVKSKPQSEVVVGSYEHNIAGRFDMIAVLHDSRFITKRATPKWTGADTDHHSAKGPEYTTFSGRTLFDLKTSKGIYTSHKIQMRGYALCMPECGMPSPAHVLVVQVGNDGSYLVGSADSVTEEDFLVTLDLNRRMQRIES